jgi:thioredoxin 1
MGTLAETSDASFKKDVLDSDLPVLVDFWAEWCPPCRVMTPILQEMAGEMAGKLKVVKLDVDVNQTTSAAYRVMSMPTFLLFKKGQVVQQWVGSRLRSSFTRKLRLI